MVNGDAVTPTTVLKDALVGAGSAKVATVGDGATAAISGTKGAPPSQVGAAIASGFTELGNFLYEQIVNPVINSLKAGK